MLHTWIVILVAFAYVGILFAVASHGDRAARTRQRGGPRPYIYALSLAVYCTSWTFFGSVGLAARSGLDFLSIYAGPVLFLIFGWPVLRAIAAISKRQNITSIADFISARYGKNQSLGALVAIIAVIGVVPYISLQLKAVSFSLETMLPAISTLPQSGAEMLGPQSLGADGLALVVTFAMAGFAILFGTRHIDTTEHQDGLILAIAVESIVKVIAFLAVGVFVTFWLFDGFGSLLARVAERPDISSLFSSGMNGTRWITMTILSMFAIVLLPRQFHVSVVENSNLNDIKKAAWLFPLYLVAINLFVIPIAMAGLLQFGDGGIDADRYVLALPSSSGHTTIALIAFVGGLSAATAMVIIESIALSIMVCNNLIVPIILRRGLGRRADGNIWPTLILVRRIAIGVILALAYSYYRMIGSGAALSQTGLLSFAAVAQFAPAVFGGLVWRGATARGAMAGITIGILAWAYTLLLPSFSDAGWIARSFLENGPFDIAALKPRMLFGLSLDPLTHGVFWSLTGNIAAYVGLSLVIRPSTLERTQANAFVSADIAVTAPNLRHWRSSTTTGQLLDTVSNYIGADRTRQSFEAFLAQRGENLDRDEQADQRLLRFAEHLLASAVGPASSRLVIALLQERRSTGSRGTARLLDDATLAIQHNRDILQSAIDHVRQGIAVFDSSLNLICWNRQFRYLLGLPKQMRRVGVPLDDVMAFVFKNSLDSKDDNTVFSAKASSWSHEAESFQQRMKNTGLILDVRSSKMPDDGIVVTFADITERVQAAEALQSANETLERRVIERTSALTQMNKDLDQARKEAEAANQGKTRFVAAASHDILQPLNAARLFTASLVERSARGKDGDLVRNVDASLEAVEEILNALLEISKLDADTYKPEISTFKIGNILSALERELAPSATEKGLKLSILHSTLTVRSDRHLLRRVLQNLASNAIKYTKTGKVVMGCRRDGNQVVIEVHDTGPGISRSNKDVIFREFERLGRGQDDQPGLGLGLAIVKRIASKLGHPLGFRSKPGTGSVFSISVPMAQNTGQTLTRSSKPAGIAMSFGAHNILIVDNDPPILAAMETLLSGWGCNPVACNDAAGSRRALARLSGEIDIILADYHLDSGDGIDLIEELRSVSGRNLPAILISADRSQIVQERARSSGIIYMRKPVKPASLRASMSHMLNRTHAAE